MSDVAVRVEGLSQFARNLKKLDKDLPKAVRLAFNVAADLVVDATTPVVPRRRGRARGSIKAKSTRVLARVSAGGRRAPHYPWLDFGGRVGRKQSVERQFRKRGRYLYLKYFKLRDSGEFQEVMSEELIGVAKQAGIEID